MAFLKEGQPETGRGPAYKEAKPLAEVSSGIEVQESDLGLPPELEEATILYANGRAGDAAAVLSRFLLDHPNNRDPQPWYMLFDLYEATGQAGPFEDAAVDFAVRFERSPPTWSGRDKQRGKKAQAVATMIYGEKYGSLERVKLQRFIQDAELAPYVRLDFSKTQVPDEDCAKAILNDMVRLGEMHKPIELIGGPAFGVRLNAARQGERLTESGWFLLLAVLQLMGKQDDFENVAIDYAVAFEVSPPSYIQPLPIPKGAVASGDVPGKGRQFALTGVLAPGAEDQFTALKEYCHGRIQAEIDLSQVVRIDFAMVGLMLDTLLEITQGGCKVLLKEGSELVNALLHIVGVNQVATVLGRTRV
ncbi:MAG: hypothetical protein HZB71_01770 [Betaproteobacteria bacterium]|nr:hypothetical protein [Betaproteobacteria bacterium]